MLTLAHGLVAFSTGQLNRAKENLERAEVRLTEGCAGANWELSTTRYALALTYANLGSFRTLRERAG
ncbi:MAG: hypothetical protein AAB325_13730, partial [Pseudomonadota bacterium]